MSFSKGSRAQLLFILASLFIILNAMENVVLCNLQLLNPYLEKISKVNDDPLLSRGDTTDRNTVVFNKPKSIGPKDSARDLALTYSYYSYYNPTYGVIIYTYIATEQLYGQYYVTYKSSYVGQYSYYSYLSYSSYLYSSYLYSSYLSSFMKSYSSYSSYSYLSYLSYSSYQYSSYLYSSYKYSLYQYSYYLYSSYSYYSYYKYYDYLSYQSYLYYSNRFPDWGIPAIVIPLMFTCGVSIPLACCAAPLCCKTRFTRGVAQTTCRKSTKQLKCCKKKTHKYKRTDSEYQKAKERGLVSGDGFKPSVPSYHGPAQYPASYTNSTMPMNYPQQYPVAAPMVQQYPVQAPMGQQYPMQTVDQPMNAGYQSNPQVFYPQPQVQIGVVHNDQVGPQVNYQVAPSYQMDQNTPQQIVFDQSTGNNHSIESSRINLVDDLNKKHI